MKRKPRRRPCRKKPRNTVIAPSMDGSERFASESTVFVRKRKSRQRKIYTMSGTICRFLQRSDIMTSLVREGKEPVSASNYGFIQHMFRERTSETIQRPSAECGPNRENCSGL